MKMNNLKHCLFLVFLLPVSIGGCATTYDHRETFCENHFSLINDYKGIYKDEGDYMSFLSKKSYFDVYYYPNKQGYNCHYYLEYISGEVIDEWGQYSIIDNNMYLRLNNDESMTFEFSRYGSPSIDFILIGQLTHNGSNYHILYSARYLFSARG